MLHGGWQRELAVGGSLPARLPAFTELVVLEPSVNFEACQALPGAQLGSHKTSQWECRAGTG